MSALGKVIRWTLLGLMLAPVIALGSCVLTVWLGTAREDWNQKMTVTVETPSGEVSGASVVRIDWEGTQGHFAEITRNLPGAKSRWDVTGEAVALEVRPGRWLFALLKSEWVYQSGDAGRNLAAMIAVPQKVPYSTVEGMRLVRAFPAGRPLTLSRDAFAGTKATPDSTLPLLVTFDDLADPMSVRKVDPTDLAATFGPGVRLVSVTVEKTDEAVTEGQLDRLLPWLGPYPEPALGPSTGGDLATSPFYLRVHIGDFIRR